MRFTYYLLFGAWLVAMLVMGGQARQGDMERLGYDAVRKGELVAAHREPD